MFVGAIIVGVILGAIAGVAAFLFGYGLIFAFLIYVGVGVISVLTVSLCYYLLSRRKERSGGSRVSVFGIDPKRSSSGSETDSRI